MASKAPQWERRYSRKLFWTDIAAVVITVVGAQCISMFTLSSRVGAAPTDTSRLAFSLLLVAGWLTALAVYDSRSETVYGTGPEEYKRVFNATILTFGITALMLLFFDSPEIRRTTLFIALPLGLFLLLLGRLLWRKRLQNQRRRKKNTYRTLIVGAQEVSAQMVRRLRYNTLAGFDLIGAVTDAPPGEDLVPGVPVVGGYADLMGAIDRLEAETIIITGAHELPPKRIRSIGWELEGRNVDLIIASSLTDIAGPRIHVRPVSGLPLIHVESPQFIGWRYWAKRVFDIVTTVLLLPFALIVMLALAVAIRLDSAGPVLFRQVRMGINGKPFTMLKLRSMRIDAEEALPTLLDESDGDGALFKIKEDPRVTRVGKFARRHSLDELPQLFNVLKGDMSLVGPRPPLPREVDQYAEWVSRRLLVRPGISGLWQVSGRSDLSWDESVRLDLFYVENWSIMGDMLILWRTVHTVFKPKGAY